ncbi:MAG: RHS repeat-associated core domain-containing protein [Candidatus Neomarinimicrobiota bacterium]
MRGSRKEEDTEFGLYYFGARYYPEGIPTGRSPAGRFAQTDPLWQDYPGWSPYVYGLDNPLKYVDPGGKQTWPLPYSEIKRGGGQSQSLTLKPYKRNKWNIFLRCWKKSWQN